MTAKIQRCQWHKRENIVKYVGLSQQEALREKLRRAYAKSTYDAAKGALLQIRRELSPINLSAAEQQKREKRGQATFLLLSAFLLRYRSLMPRIPRGQGINSGDILLNFSIFRCSMVRLKQI